MVFSKVSGHMAVFTLPSLFSIPVSSVFIPSHLWDSGLKLVQGALRSISIQFPVQSDEVQGGALWIMVLLCRAPSFLAFFPFPFRLYHFSAYGNCGTQMDTPVFPPQPLPTFILQTQHISQRKLIWDSQIILSSSWIWLSPFSRLSNWGVKLFSESQHWIPGLQNCSPWSFHCNSTNIPAQ